MLPGSQASVVTPPGLASARVPGGGALMAAVRLGTLTTPGRAPPHPSLRPDLPAPGIQAVRGDRNLVARSHGVNAGRSPLETTAGQKGKTRRGGPRPGSTPASERFM